MGLDSEAAVPLGLESNAPATAGTDSDKSRDADSSPSLLLLEDDSALREMLASELSELGYRILAVGSCREARAVAAVHDVDLALLDIGLPDGDGAELASELIKLRPALRIVLCSGRPVTLTSGHLPTEIVTCLAKPVSLRRLDALFRSRA